MTELDKNTKLSLLADLNESIQAMMEFRTEGDDVASAWERGFINGMRTTIKYFGYRTESKRDNYGVVEKYTDIVENTWK